MNNECLDVSAIKIVGEENISDLKWLNSVVRALLKCDKLNKYFLSPLFESHVEKIMKEKKRAPTVALEYGNGIVKGAFSKGVIDLNPFKDEMKSRNSNFVKIVEARKGISQILIELHEDLNLGKEMDKNAIHDIHDDKNFSFSSDTYIKAFEAEQAYRTNNQSIISDLFGGMYVILKSCTGCSSRNVMFKPFFNIPMRNEIAKSAKKFNVLVPCSSVEKKNYGERVLKHNIFHYNGENDTLGYIRKKFAKTLGKKEKDFVFGDLFYYRIAYKNGILSTKEDFNKRIANLNTKHMVIGKEIPKNIKDFCIVKVMCRNVQDINHIRGLGIPFFRNFPYKMRKSDLYSEMRRYVRRFSTSFPPKITLSIIPEDYFFKGKMIVDNLEFIEMKNIECLAVDFENDSCYKLKEAMTVDVFEQSEGIDKNGLCCVEDYFEAFSENKKFNRFCIICKKVLKHHVKQIIFQIPKLLLVTFDMSFQTIHEKLYLEHIPRNFDIAPFVGNKYLLYDMKLFGYKLNSVICDNNVLYYKHGSYWKFKNSLSGEFGFCKEDRENENKVFKNASKCSIILFEKKNFIVKPFLSHKTRYFFDIIYV